jgi:hypothetical protein
VGFLDNLKRQADALKTQQSQDGATLARHTALVEAACKSTLQYWLELAPQLNVLQVKPKVRFSLDNRTPLENLVRCDFRVDSRRRQLRDQEVFDHVVLHGVQRSGQSLTLVKDFPPEIERLEARLRQAGITADVTAVRNPQNNSLQEMRYTFKADVVAMVRLLPDHDAGRVRFQVMNLDGFETLTAEFAAHQVGSGLLDELARWLTGEPHQFLKDALDRRLVEA